MHHRANDNYYALIRKRLRYNRKIRYYRYLQKVSKTRETV